MAGYVPRAVAPLAPWTVAGLRLKPYLLRAAGREADAARLAQARACLTRALAGEAPESGIREGGIGFAILHLGQDADWLLADWWVNGDMLAQRLFAGNCGGGPFLPVAPRPLMACVWELAVIGHERAAFIAAMMDPAGGGADAYLADVLPEGVC